MSLNTQATKSSGMQKGQAPANGTWLDRGLIWVMVGALALLLIALLSWQIPLGTRVQLGVGEVAPYDVLAPRQITYESDVLTEQARDRAALSVQDQYDAAEGRIRRRQVNRARELLEFMSIVRQDEYAAPELKTDYLLAISELGITPATARAIIELDDAAWQQVVTDVPVVLDLMMRDEIRDTSLASVRRRIPALIDSDIEEDLGMVTVELVRALVSQNSFVNVDRTEEQRIAARESVPVQQVTIEQGEVIIRAGDIAAAEDVEALHHIGLLQSEWDWWLVLRSALLTLAVFTVTGLALQRLRQGTLSNIREVAIMVAISGIWLVGAKFMVIPHDWLPYLYPLAALSMLLAVLLDLRVSVILTVAFLFVIQYMSDSNSAIVLYAGVGALMGALVLGRAERLTAFVWAGLLIVLSNVVTIAAYQLPYFQSTTQVLQLHAILLLNGALAASIALIGYFVVGNVFGITTSLQLTELSRPTHPLLRQLLLKSPGTYHHTIVVSNLAERAAAAIGADAFLSRVGAYYHDIGKTVRPYFFTENIVEGNSPHKNLDPYTSAQIIISHVKDGLDLAEKYHLPPRIRDFIREHHGRSLVKYFYIQAQQEAPEGTTVDEADFRYPGPKPQTKETAIMLLADTCEAAVRSIRPSSRDELEQLIHRLMDERIADGELDDSNLTFSEVQTVRTVFMRVLEGVHHPRITYPEPVRQEMAAPADAAASAGGDKQAKREAQSIPARLSSQGGTEEIMDAGNGSTPSPAPESVGGDDVARTVQH